jgi:hypothetical protein
MVPPVRGPQSLSRKTAKWHRQVGAGGEASVLKWRTTEFDCRDQAVNRSERVRPWLRRYKEGGAAALEDASSRPRISPRTLSNESFASVGVGAKPSLPS